MRIAPISVSMASIARNVFPVIWPTARHNVAETPNDQMGHVGGKHRVDTMVDDRLFRPNLNINYEKATSQPREAGQKSLLVANIAPQNIDIWKKIKKYFGIELINTVEACFNREEMQTIFNTLSEVPKQHLAGIESIIKSFSLGLEMELMHTKTHGKTILGAYQKGKKRIHLFKSCHISMMRKTLLHEIGHAVHSYCSSTRNILEIAKEAGWKLREFVKSFLAENTFYPMVYQEIPVTNDTWEAAYHRFSEQELRKMRTIDGRFQLESPSAQKNNLMYKNPLETFACLYEQGYR